MDTNQPLPLLGGMTARQFMKRHWHKKPLLVRAAVPGMDALLSASELFALAGEAAVESRLVSRRAGNWQMRRGPLPRRSLPPLSRPGWTLLLQGMDLHHRAFHALLQQFSFVPQARLDDLMVSFATDGGGVGPHVDSYDVFLLQAQGRRRWQIGRQKDMGLEEGVPLKILANFTPQEDYLLEAGDMLYLPPGYAHDGVAQGQCQTYSIGFRSPARGELACELLQRLADGAQDVAGDALYRDPGQKATEAPGAIPQEMRKFARDALRAALKDEDALDRALGEHLTEPKATVWFDTASAPIMQGALALDRRSRMLYDPKHVFLNGESWRASGRDAALMRKLADHRRLPAADVARASEGASALLQSWCEAGWLHDEAADLSETSGR